MQTQEQFNILYLLVGKCRCNDYILEQSKEGILQFSKGTTKVL